MMAEIQDVYMFRRKSLMVPMFRMMLETHRELFELRLQELLQMFNATTVVRKMEEIEELSANICLMARIQPTNFNSDEGPSYDSTFLNEKVQKTPSTVIYGGLEFEARRFKKESQSQFIHDRDIIRDLEQQRNKLELSVVELKRQTVELQKTQLILKHKMSENEDKDHDIVLDLEARAKKNEDVVLKIEVRAQNQDLLITISEIKAKLKTVEKGLGHNLFSVGQLCDDDLEFAFRSNTCYVRNLEGDDLLTRARESNLYTISISDMDASSPVCLFSKATSTKSWLWHRILSHLNFGTINDLTKNDLVDGLPKFKYSKDHLCSACERGKRKKSSHPPKLVPSTHSKLELLHMDLCGPIRVATINGKKYILMALFGRGCDIGCDICLDLLGYCSLYQSTAGANLSTAKALNGVDSTRFKDKFGRFYFLINSLSLFFIISGSNTGDYRVRDSRDWECKFKGSKEGSRQEAGRGQDFKPVRTEKEALMTIDEGQINWVEQTTDEELNHALMAFTVNNEVSMCSKLCLDSYNALQAKYDELQSEFGDQEAALVAHKLAVKKLESQLKASHKQQSSLTEKLNFQANQIFEKDEKLKKYRRIGMKAVKDKDALQKIVDSWFASSKNLWKLIDCGMSSTVKIGLGYGIQSNAEVLGYEEEMSRGIFVLRETDAGYYDIPLYSRFKQVEYKGVPHPLSGDYTPREQEDIDDSLTISHSRLIQILLVRTYKWYQPVSDASSTVYSTCPSNDSDGELGAVSDHSVTDDPIHDHIPIPSIEQVTIATQKTQPQVPKPKQTVVPSCAQHIKTPRQPIRTPVTPSPSPSNNRQNWNQRMERELGAGYSFERKTCFVCGSLSHLIKDCDYYEKKMARETALKNQRVVHANVRQATPAWTNTNRVNRPVQLSNIRPNHSTASKTIKTGRVNVNTGHGHVSTVSSAGTHIKSGSSRFNTGKQNVNSGTHIKSGSSRFNTGKQNVNSGSVHVNTARVNRPVSNQTSNKTSPKLSQVNLKSSKKCFSKQSSPVNRPFSRNTAHKSNKYAVKGKMGTAVYTTRLSRTRRSKDL
ncbi:integrase, catalytic region, zinc finger, CCHC-type containing protein [Tanacetum coccineum]